MDRISKVCNSYVIIISNMIKQNTNLWFEFINYNRE